MRGDHLADRKSSARGREWACPGCSAQRAKVHVLIEKVECQIRTDPIIDAGAGDPTDFGRRRLHTCRLSERAETAVQADIAVGEAAGAVKHPWAEGPAQAAAKR